MKRTLLSLVILITVVANVTAAPKPECRNGSQDIVCMKDLAVKIAKVAVVGWIFKEADERVITPQCTKLMGQTSYSENFGKALSAAFIWDDVKEICKGIRTMLDNLVSPLTNSITDLVS